MVKLKPIASLPIDPLESRRLRIVLATIVINVAAVALLALAPWSDWKTGLALNLFDNTLLLGFVVALLYRLPFAPLRWLLRALIEWRQRTRTKIGFLTANIAYGLERNNIPELRGELKRLLGEK